VRGRLIDILLLIVALIAAIWLALLLYHNYFGGHVEPPAAVGARGSGGSFPAARFATR
jgi:hypothetical protein